MFNLKERTVSTLANAIFSIRWGLAPLYLGLYVAMAAYVYKFGQEVFHLVTHLSHMTSETLLLATLELIDITMVGNLIVMTTVGGYLLFVDEHAFDNMPMRPRWMQNIDTTTMKIKMGMSLIGVSSIHLLSTFMKSTNMTWSQVGMELAIHMMFCVTTLAYVVIGNMMHGHSHSKTESH